MLLKLIIFFFSNMYCGASEMFLNPGSGDARGEDSYWSSIPFWMRSGMWFILIIFSVFWSVIRVVIFSRWFYIYCVDAKRILISLFEGFQYFGMHFHFGWKLSEWWKDYDKLKVVPSESFSLYSQYFQPAFMYMMPKMFRNLPRIKQL